MSGGVIEIGGRASERLGGPLPGETIGMKGGIAVVRGDAGERTGDRMRGGLILVENRAGPYSGSRMIAGTLIVRKRAAAFPGYLMQRGTLVLGEGCDRLSPTFLDCGVHDLLALRLIGAFVHRFSPQLSRLLQRPSRRFAGDVAVLGKGEIFCPPG
jgi:formylmethanofuran dehydrogenase subunit C